jgi:hypothetical protein
MSKEVIGDYEFHYVNDPILSGKIRIYILRQPSYNGRDENLVDTHRLPSKNKVGPKYYICFKEGREPTTEEGAKRFARDWAKRTDDYIQTGVTISGQIARE